MKNALRNSHKLVFIIGCFLLYGLASTNANARSLSKRLGIGYVSQIAAAADRNLPMVDAKYYFSRKWATSLGLGFDTRTDGSEIGIGVKIYRNMFHKSETNMNFYLGTGLALFSRDGAKLQVQFFFGSEFFLQGLPSLGLSFEVGVRGDNSRGNFALRTTGDSFLNSGIHFYF